MRTLSAAVAVSVALSLSAATFDRVTDASLVERSDLIVVARVENAASRLLDRSVVTDYRLSIEQVLRGNATGSTVTVTEYGGSADGLIMAVAGSAYYQPGTRVVAFLRANGIGTYSTSAMALGAFRFARARDGREILVRSEEGLDVASADDIAPRDASELIDFARGLTATAPQPLPLEQNTRIEPKPAAAPSAFVIGGGSPSRPLRWNSFPNCNTGDNCPKFKINGAQAVTDSLGGVGAGLGAWNGDLNSYIQFKLDGLTALDTAHNSNGVNQILLDNSTSGPLPICDGAIACGFAWANDEAPTHTFQGETFYTVFEGDILFRPGAFTQNAFEAIMAHEAGHSLAFRHAPSGGAIMSNPTPTSQGATLRDYDKEAAATVYGNGLPCTAPAITGITGGGTIQYGNRTTLVATVTGSTPITYQWYEGAAPDTSSPVGSNQASFQTPNITIERKYWLKVTNCANTPVSSSTVTVTPTECNRPVIGTQPLSQRIEPNKPVSLSITATGTTPLTYAWYEGSRGDTTKKVGSNSNSFTSPNLTANTTYWVRVTNACGSDDSDAAVITVGTQCVPPAIALQPESPTLQVGSKALLHVAATGDVPITFQWYEGDAPDTTKPIAGATSAVHEPGPFTTAGTFKFWAKATNSCGHANSNTAVVTVSCPAAATPVISGPPVAPSALGYPVSWTGNLGTTGTFELQESSNDSFSGAKTYTVSNALQFAIPAHAEVTADTRFYYRVRGISQCTGQPTGFSSTTNTLVIAPLPHNSSEFVIGLPVGTTQNFLQNYLVPGFGETATNADTFTITSEVPWITVFPASGALSAGGTTVQFTVHPGGVNVGSTTATLNVTRVNGTAALVGLHGSTSTTVPISVSLVTPVTPAPRDTTPPAGTLLIPAIAHADGLGARFQSDVRIANAASEPITYELSFTPSTSDGTATGKKTTMIIASNETRGLDDVVKIWFGSGVAGEAQLGTLEIRPIKLASGGVPSALATIASSRTYAISSAGTLGQFIPALPLSGFIGDVAKDALAKISLQQITNNNSYRTNIGFVEGSGAPADILVRLIDANNSVVKSVPFQLNPYEHKQLGWGGVFGNEVTIANGRIEVQVTSTAGKATAYASVLDNDTTDPLLVFPVQAGKLSASRYVVPGVAELNAGSNFHTDMRIFNPNANPVTLSLSYRPQTGDATPIPAAVSRTVAPGQILAIDNVLPTLWSLNASGGAVTVSAPNATPLVVTARTFSREADGGTYGQFIPAVTSTDAVGLGERALEILQLEDSGERSQKTGFRSNLGLVEVTGNRAVVELTVRPPDSKLTAIAHVELEGGQFMQIPQIFRWAGFTNVYNGRVSVRVVEGLGRVAGYGSVVDNRTEDPTYVPTQ